MAGPVHDSCVFHNTSLKHRLENNLLHGILLGDSGYLQLRYLFTPAPELIMPNRPLMTPGDPMYHRQLQKYRDALRLYHAQMRYNKVHKRVRNSVEWYVNNIYVE